MKWIAVLISTALAFAGPASYSQKRTERLDSHRLSSDVLIDSLSHALLGNYVFPDMAAVMIKQLQNRESRLKYQKIPAPAALAAQIESDLKQWHRDAHLHLSYDPEFESHLRKPRGPKPEIDSGALKRSQQSNFGFQKVEILNGNIGYVEFTEFNPDINSARETVSAAFRFLQHTTELVIDLRRNGGGSPAMVKHIAGYLVQERTRLNDIYNRPRNDTIQYWADPAEGNDMKLRMPVYILTDRRTFSAAEDFAYAFQVNRRAILVGDTTRGGAHPTISIPVGQGFVLDVPFARSINHKTKTDWEGTGVRPDIPCAGETALDVALREILRSRRAQADEEGEQRQAQWLMDALRANDYQCNPDIDTWQAYCGQYGRFSIHLRDRRLFLNDFTGRTFLLRPISKNHFLADDWLQVQFIENEGRIAQMRMMGKPGWVDIQDKSEEHEQK